MKSRLPAGMMGGGAQNMQGMMKQVQKMQADVTELQRDIEEREFSNSVGGGAVSLTMSGKKEIKSLTIKPEVVDPDDIQDIGKGRFINIADETVRVIRPEDFTPVKKRSYAEEKLYILTLKNSAFPIGFLVRKVLDKLEAVFTLDNTQLYSDFIFGTSVYNEKILIFLNLAAIAEGVETDKVSRRVVRKGGTV